MKIGRRGGFYKAPHVGANALVVALHAFARTPATLSEVARVVREVIPNSDLYVPRMPAWRFSMRDPKGLALKLVADIEKYDGDARLNRGNGYRKLFL